MQRPVRALHCERAHPALPPYSPTASAVLSSSITKDVRPQEAENFAKAYLSLSWLGAQGQFLVGVRFVGPATVRI